MLEKLGSLMYINEDRILPHIHKVNSKWTKDKYKIWYHKTSRREQRQKLMWHKSENIFLGHLPREKKIIKYKIKIKLKCL